MKKLILPILSIIILASCGDKGNSENAESANVLEDLTYTVDTLIVDPGEEIINLSWGLRLADISADKKKMYVYNEVDQSLAVIDLESLQLLEKLQFEKDGPNGVGQYISGVQLLAGEKFVFSSFRSSGIFDRFGQKTLDLNLSQKDIEGLDQEDDNPLSYGVLLSNDGKTHFSLPGDFFSGTRDLAIVDPINKTGKIIDIPVMDKAGEYRIVLQSDEMMSVYIEEINLQIFDENLYISSSVTSKIYRYNITTDSLQLLEFPHQITAIEKTGEVQNEVSSQSEFEAEMAKLNSQIRYDKLVWDESSQRFFRFGAKLLPKVNEEAPRKSEVFLYSFDKDLKLLGETELAELTTMPEYPFFKDGKLWSYVNVEDELGFAVFTFDF